MPSAAALLVAARGIRAFGDGLTALALPLYLTSLGWGALQVGVLTAATLLGSAALTLGVGLTAHRASPRRLLLAASGLMLLTGLAFAEVRGVWALALVGFAGTLNPSGGDVSLFLPLEQALLAQAGPDAERTARFARYSLVGSLMAALGALAVAGVEPLRAALGAGEQAVFQAIFVFYGLLGLVVAALYRRLPPAPPAAEPPAALGPSRRRVLALAALFSLDSLGGGFLVQSLLALWLLQRFDLSAGAAGAFFFWAGLLSAGSQLAAPRLARRIGLIRTMVFTHLPANLCVMAAAFAPSLGSALALLLIRAALSQMDVPARTSYVMAVVTPPERAAAAGVTNVPRSLASALSPALAGWLLSASPLAWPLIIGGGLKIAYDLLLLRQFASLRPPEE